MTTIPGSPLDAERLEEIRRDVVAREEWPYRNGAEQDCAALLDHVDYLEALLSDALGHGEMDQWRAGRLAGLEEAARWLEQHLRPEYTRNLVVDILRLKESPP